MKNCLCGFRSGFRQSAVKVDPFPRFSALDIEPSCSDGFILRRLPTSVLEHLPPAAMRPQVQRRVQRCPAALVFDNDLNMVVLPEPMCQD
ncbi:hypothetical protein CRG98_040006 [Punica granatum]|uniref:Uncharacterized protein n=1 Tax=Punica granatum TaxID=22663 RepID=A0A2I0I803_PUNGR|nr:hypothetical protein CRG98_040006 [Punica granatum]